MPPVGEGSSLRKESMWSCSSRRIPRIKCAVSARDLGRSFRRRSITCSGGRAARVRRLWPSPKCPKGSPCRYMSDLKSKAGAICAARSLRWMPSIRLTLVLRRIILEHGLDFDRGDYQLVPLGTTGARLESMTRGETFAGVLNPPWDRKAEAEGHKRFADHREVLPDYPGGVFAVSRKWAGENRQLLVKFLSIWHNALRWCGDDANRSDVFAIIAAEEKVDEAAAARKLAQLPPSGKLNLAGLQTVLDLRVQFGLTPVMGKDLATYCEESFYREASNS